MANPTASKLIEGCKAEQSLFWIDEATGLTCKARPDAWRGVWIGDIKTCNDASYRSFQRSILSFGYDIQCGMIAEGIKHCTGDEVEAFVFIAVESSPPYAVACYQLDELWLEAGKLKFHNLLERLKVCFDSKEFPGYPNTIIEMPKWSSDE